MIERKKKITRVYNVSYIRKNLAFEKLCVFAIFKRLRKIVLVSDSIRVLTLRSNSYFVPRQVLEILQFFFFCVAKKITCLIFPGVRRHSETVIIKINRKIPQNPSVTVQCLVSGVNNML